MSWNLRWVAVALLSLLPLVVVGLGFSDAPWLPEHLKTFLAPLRLLCLVLSPPSPGFLVWAFFCYWLFFSDLRSPGYALRIRLLIQAEGDPRETLNTAWLRDFDLHAARRQGKRDAAAEQAERDLLATRLREVSVRLLDARPWWTYGKAERVRLPYARAQAQYQRWYTLSQSQEHAPGALRQGEESLGVGYVAVTVMLYAYGNFKPPADAAHEIEAWLLGLTDTFLPFVGGVAVDWAPEYGPGVLSEEQATLLFPDLHKL
ncbi:DUF1517 domain-containing protein [Deinococcus wulumuqiensis]|uniref:DUF1517 domain-containing protein n=1 Tax=Deinococcus wulumuqiensis TaxID=980427 RepID=A0AAV4KCB5_9DEIO|nr:DUF1517 domain-containing protein [Deinococcus wulumuqiensis]QII19997.1 DUF1517 domain-containing protein [Deinococcus wulumuqiensis R12]GGI67853.1 hypothetical protein GCM10008021_30070 [Deinococcus wulumuqiensis]GGI94069.1 hypothetical protein GCM10010914_30850 [Deinococcus wulumuqiensis]